MPSRRGPAGRLARRVALVGALVALASFSATGLAAAGSPGAQSGVRPQATTGVGRFSGADRFATAADISYHTFTDPIHVQVVYIANAWNFPDALAGAAAAGVVHGPILLANATGELNPSTISELQRIVPDRCVILGGQSAISNDVMNKVAHYCRVGVVRYYGNSRFETAADVSKKTFVPTSMAQVAYVANAANFPDALTGAAAAGFQHGPILLANATGSLNAATVAELQRLDPAKIVILGGPGAISHEVEETLQIYGSTTRYQGVNRFATAADVSKKVFADTTKVQTVYIANAYNFPDALAGAAAAGWTDSGLSQGPILLADKNLPLNAATVAELQRIQPQRIVVLGGTGVISQAVENSLDQYLGPPGP